MEIPTGYFDNAHRPDFRQEVIGRAITCLGMHEKDYDVIACRGYSGMMVAPILAYMLKKDIFAVRKPTEQNHQIGFMKGVGQLGKRYLIVDDFVATGSTVEAIIEIVKAAHKHVGLPEPQFVAIYCYCSQYGERLEAPHCPQLRIWR